MESIILLPQLTPSEFLPIFVSATMVLVFGVAYAGTVTLSKMGYLHKRWVLLGYIFWASQTYMLYKLSVLIHSSPFTSKVLMVTMIAYLFVPHLYFQLISESEARYEDIES